MTSYLPLRVWGLLLASGLLFAGLASAQSTGATAFRALFVAGKSSDGARLVHISGERGSTQPQAWKFFYLDPSARGGIREVVVSSGTVDSVRTPLRGYSEIVEREPVPLGLLKVDSDRAFEIANAEAVRARVGFHWLNYELGMDRADGPVWSLTFLDKMGVNVASLRVSAESGAVVGSLRRDGFSGVDRAEEPPREPVGGLIGDLRDLGLGLGKTAANSVLRVAGTTQEILTGERTIKTLDNE